MNLLKQSTAATVKLGAFVDDTDGKTAKTGLTISQADIRLSKNGGDFAQTNNSAGATHDEFGYYDIPLDTTDTGTLGRLRVAVSESGALPVWQDFLVVTANVYDTLCSTDNLDVNVATIATDSITAAALKADAVTKIQNGLATAAALDTVDNFLDTEIAAILADTNELQTDLVNGGRLDLLIDSIITHLTDIKGAGWTSETLSSIQDSIWSGFAGENLNSVLYNIGLVKTDTDAIKAKTDNLPATPADEATLTAIKGVGWTNQTLVKIVTDISNISAGSGATPQQIWEYATRVLTAGTNIDLSALATATMLTDIHDTDLPAVKTAVDAILVDTGTTLDTLIKDIPTNTELATALGTADDAVLAAVAAAKVVIDDIHNTDLPAVKAETALIVEDTGTTIPALLETIDNFLDTEVAAILEDTGTTLPATLATLAGYTDGIAGDVWSHPHRTLTNQGIEATSPASGDPLIIYRDTTVYISLTGLGDTTGAAATKIFFTAKENLEDADSSSIIQLVCTRANPISDPDTDDLLYINKAAPTAATEGTFVFADHTDGTAEITIAAVASADLPIYAATPLYWDVKMVTAAGVSTILSTGLMYIYGTSTRAVA